MRAGRSRSTPGASYWGARATPTSCCAATPRSPAATRRWSRAPDGDASSLTDLGSTNGTFVDGHRIAGSVFLRGGERVRVGDTTFVVERPPAAQPTMLGAGAAAHAPPAAPGAAPQPPLAAQPPAAFRPPSGAPPPQGPCPPQGVHPPQGLPPPAQPGAPLPIPPPPQSPSMIERVRLRRSVTRANVLALAAIGIAVVVVGRRRGARRDRRLRRPASGGDAVDRERGLRRHSLDRRHPDPSERQPDRGRHRLGPRRQAGPDRQPTRTSSTAATSWTIKVGDEQRQGIFVAAAPCEDQARAQGRRRDRPEDDPAGRPEHGQDGSGRDRGRLPGQRLRARQPHRDGGRGLGAEDRVHRRASTSPTCPT